MANKRLLAILAHPDDESFPIGGTLARYAEKGAVVDLLVATRGEAGIPGKSADETATLREKELRRACAVLGINPPKFLGFFDGRLDEIPEETGVMYILAALTRLKPDVVITFGPDGISGHPDHVRVNRWTAIAFDQLHQESDGPQRLYYIAPSEATQQGCGIPPAPHELEGPMAYIDVGDYLINKVRAAQQHRSQNPPFTDEPAVEAQRLACHEVFRMARPRQSANGHEPETELFP
jgi:N-acetylglucosamine malate deacetylase 2